MLNLRKGMNWTFSNKNMIKKGGKSILFIFLFTLFLNEVKAQCPSLFAFATNSPLNCITSSSTGTVTVSGGTPPYTYTWLPTGGNFSVAPGLTPNNYTINVKDANGCPGQANLIINNSAAVTIVFSVINVSCFGLNNGQISTTLMGSPNFPVTYSWTPSAPPTSSLTNLASGNYSLVVKDNFGCTYTGSTTVTQPPALTGTISSKTIACNGGLSSATVTAAGGPTTSTTYSYSWAPTVSTSSVINNIPAGNYSVTITDANSCTQTVTTTITQPAPIQNTMSLTHVSCNTFTNGQATSNLSGGTPVYSYTWLPMNVPGSSVSGLSSGSYTLLVKDSKLCTFTQTFSINQPAPITYTFAKTDEFCINADGTATVNVSGGNGPYTYSWTTSPAQTGSVATGLAAGTYTVFITDVNSCSITAAVTIGNMSNMSASITSKTDVTCFGLCNGGATGKFSGGNRP